MSSEEILAEYRFSGFSVDVRRRKIVSPDGEQINLSSRAFDTLLVLLENHGETLSKSELMQTVWSSAVVEENNLNQAIFSLRRALGDTKSDSRFILTVPGRGYCFVAPVEIRWTHTDGDINTTLQSSFSSPKSTNTTGSPERHVTHQQVLTVLTLLTVFVMGFYLLGFRDQSGNDQVEVVSNDSAVSGFESPELNRIDDSIAVLPFTTIDSNAGNDMFVAGLHVEVINRLAKIRGLNVISRNSVLSLVEQQIPLKEIATLLNVESLLSGTVLFSGERARINLNMYDADSGVSLWSKTYDANKQDLAEMFLVQSDIALDVASALEAEIKKYEKRRVASVPTNSVDAYRYHLSAQIAHYQQDFRNEWSWSRQAIELDPDYYDAHATFSLVNTVLITFPLPDMTKQDHFRMALASADRLIELSPRNSKGYALKAVALSTNKDWEGVSRILEKLESMNAPMANMSYIAVIMLCFGDFDSAIDIYRANLQTEPLNLYARGFLMAALELAGRREEARQEYAYGESLSPVWWGDTVNMFLALGRGEPLQGVEEITMISGELKSVMRHIEDKEKLNAALAGFKKSKNWNSAESIHLAALAAYAGNHELAVEFLEYALRNNWSALFWAWLPVFDDTRKLPGFRALLVETGIVDYWESHGWPRVCQPTAGSFACEWSAYPE